MAKNKPESVGRITLPSQLVRFTIPFSKSIQRTYIIRCTSRQRADIVKKPSAAAISRIAGR